MSDENKDDSLDLEADASYDEDDLKHWQTKPHDNFSWATLIYLWFISGLTMFSLGCFLIDEVYPKFYHFDPLSAVVKAQGLTPALNLVYGDFGALWVALIAYYIMGRNKPYWMNPLNLDKKKSVCAFWIGLLLLKALAGSVVFAMISSTYNATTDTTTEMNTFNNFKSAYVALTGSDEVQPLDAPPVHLDETSLECKRRRRAVNGYINEPMTSPVGGLMRKRFILGEMGTGCLSLKDGFNDAVALAKRTDAIRYPHEYILEFIKPAFKKVDHIYADKIQITAPEWCSVLVYREAKTQDDVDQGIAQCGKLPSTKLTKLPSNMTYEAFVGANRKD